MEHGYVEHHVCVYVKWTDFRFMDNEQPSFPVLTSEFCCFVFLAYFFVFSWSEKHQDLTATKSPTRSYFTITYLSL